MRGYVLRFSLRVSRKIIEKIKKYIKHYAVKDHTGEEIFLMKMRLNL